jgi:hypothetical protein
MPKSWLINSSSAHQPNNYTRRTATNMPEDQYKELLYTLNRLVEGRGDGTPSGFESLVMSLRGEGSFKDNGNSVTGALDKVARSLEDLVKTQKALVEVHVGISEALDGIYGALRASPR